MEQRTLKGENVRLIQIIQEDKKLQQRSNGSEINVFPALYTQFEKQIS